MEVDCIVDVSQEHIASIIRAEVRSVVEVDGLKRDRSWIRHGHLLIRAMR
jgi:hypothetical protein